MEVIVGILSLLVTVLIGWNIYSVIDIKRESKVQNDKLQSYKIRLNNSIKSQNKKIENNKEEQDKRITDEFVKIKTYTNSVSIFLQAEIYNRMGRYFIAYRQYLNAAHEFLKSEIDDTKSYQDINVYESAKSNLGTMLRKINIENHIFTLDYDLEGDKRVRKLEESLSINMKDEIGCMKKMLGSKIEKKEICNYAFEIFFADAQIFKREYALYVFFRNDGKFVIEKTHEGMEQRSSNKVELVYEKIGMYVAKDYEERDEVYKKIKSDKDCIES